MTAEHSDLEGDNSLPTIDDLITPDAPNIDFNLGEISKREVLEVIARARTKSAPGFSGTAYKVYKKCPKIAARLAKLLNVAWKKEIIPECWQRAEGCFVPK